MSEKKFAEPAQLPEGGPAVGAGVTDPRALGYAAGVAARKASQSGPPKYNTPIGGGRMPPIPNLDQPHQSGMTMADQANMQRPQVPPIGGIIQPTMQAAPMTGSPLQRPPMPSPTQNLLPTDMLPDAAKNDPMFQQGMGSMSAASQPGLAMKYGVIRNGQHIPSQMLATGKPALKKETVEGLAAVAEFNKQRQAAESGGTPDSAAEKQAAASPAGAGVGSAALLEDIRSMRPKDDLDFNRIKEMQQSEILNNEDQRSIVEARLGPLELAELIINERIRQKVPISPGVFEPEFQSMSWEDEVTVKRLILEEAKKLDLSDQYLLDRYSMMGLTTGLYALNGTVLPTHLDAEGHFDNDLFWKKFDRIKKLPFHMTASLAINFFWFEVRVRRLFVMDRVKNG